MQNTLICDYFEHLERLQANLKSCRIKGNIKFIASFIILTDYSLTWMTQSPKPLHFSFAQFCASFWMWSTMQRHLVQHQIPSCFLYKELFYLQFYACKSNADGSSQHQDDTEHQLQTSCPDHSPCQNLWQPMDECGSSSDSSLRLQMFVLALTCSHSNFQYFMYIVHLLVKLNTLKLSLHCFDGYFCV